MKVLFVSSEVFPLAKTGGLADVCGALPVGLLSQGIDVRVLLPGYPGAKAAASLSGATLDLGDPLGVGATRLLEGTLPGTEVPLWLLDCPDLYEREGGLYGDAAGVDWPDNALRFGLLGRVAALLSIAGPFSDWNPDVVHAHDWQAGTAAAHLALWGRSEAKTVFTIHNLEYAGLFGHDVLGPLGLPESVFSMDGLEFYGGVSFLKSGLYYSDRITTVSPTYAREIQSPIAGRGLHGLLAGRAEQLTGILNGIDTEVWNPSTDAHLPARYSASDIRGKAENKRRLRAEVGLDEEDGPLIGVVSRLSSHKGLDLVLDCVTEIVGAGAQMVVLGSGDSELQQGFQGAARRWPGRVAVNVGFDEGLAHRIQAGSDLMLVPSRAEPCGLTQMIAQRYGTLPVVRQTGGLADSVRDVVSADKGTGFVFHDPDAPHLMRAVHRALRTYRDPSTWDAIQQRVMGLELDWARPAREYADLYEELLGEE
jgi:starch synthase